MGNQRKIVGVTGNLGKLEKLMESRGEIGEIVKSLGKSYENHGNFVIIID